LLAITKKQIKAATTELPANRCCPAGVLACGGVGAPGLGLPRLAAVTLVLLILILICLFFRHLVV
jgi:hypothetical protein